MDHYIIVDSQGYLVTWFDIFQDADVSGIAHAPDHTLVKCPEPIKIQQVLSRPPKDSGIILAYHLERARWEDRATGEPYAQPTFTITTL